MATETEVKARLTLDARQAKSQARSYQQSLQGLQEKIRGTQSATSGMIKQTLALGAAYVGISAGVAAFKSLSSSAIKYTADLEKTKIGLTSVLSAVNEVPWETGVKQANEAFKVLKEMSITSPAGPQDMFNIFQGIVGPLRNAGTEMERIYQITNDTVLASSALGVDLEQAQRDISLMARGAAGMDTKLFALLKSTGAIAESTEEWNRGLSDTERVAKLETALKKFAGSGDAFGKSWAGLTSTFKGIVDELKRAAFTPILKALGGQLSKLNDYFIQNRESLEAMMNTYGSRVASMINSAAEMAVNAFTYLQDNADKIAARWDQAMSVLKQYGPMMAKVAAGIAAVDMARGPVASAVGLAGNIVGMAGGIGGGAAAAGGGAAAEGGAVAAAAGGIAMGPLVAVLAALAAVALAIKANWEPLVNYFSGSLAPMGDQLMGLMQDTWGVLKPLLEIVGTVILTLVIPPLKMLIGAFMGAVAILRPFLRVLGSVFQLLSRIAQEAFAWFLDGLKRMDDAMGPLSDILKTVVDGLSGVADAFGTFITSLLDELDEAKEINRRRRFEEQEGDPIKKDYDASWIASQAMAGTMAMNDAFLKQKDDSGKKGGKKKVPGGRGGSTVNVQKMIIKQDFKNADPARIVTQMIGDITKQAENRVQTRFQGALTR